MPAELPDDHLVNALSQYLELEPIERQALLEVDGVLARCRSLVELLEMKVLSNRAPHGEYRHAALTSAGPPRDEDQRPPESAAVAVSRSTCPTRGPCGFDLDFEADERFGLDEDFEVEGLFALVDFARVDVEELLAFAPSDGRESRTATAGAVARFAMGAGKAPRSP